MEMRTLGNTGLKVSALGYGGAPMGYLQTDRGEVAALLNTLLDRGVNVIDTAAGYPGSEEVIGHSVSHRRNEFVLISKCPNQMTDGADCWRAPKITASVERSLQRLRTDRLDVVLLHSCGKNVLELGEALGALLKAKEAGKLGFVGYSGDNEAAAFAAGLPGISVVETSVSICDQGNLRTLVPEAQKRGIGVIAKRPLANGAWRALLEQKGIYADYAKTYTERFSAMGLSLSALGFSGEASVAWPEIALRFTLSQPGVHVAIVGTCHLAHAERNLEFVARGTLPPKACELIRAAFSEAESSSGQPWQGEI